MTTSTDGILAYGYDLGEDFGFEWDDESPRPAWVDEGDDEYFDWGGNATRVLLNASGFTETYEDGRDGYFARERDAEKALGVQLVQHCSDSCTMWLLAAKVFEAKRGCPEEVEVDLPENADERLAWAVDVLGLTKFKDKQPNWLLASWWG